ncbi:MAG: acetyl-CoA carboxylase biotin carboxyl carrier protein subunit [Bacteroidales bacterium]|nr:acetyl-CoA carboxylase biotin carboxyl carrier protein subunit [Bacteroidales bacterium]
MAKKEIKTETKVDDPVKTIVIDDGKYKTLLNKKYLKRKPYKAIDPSLITAIIPGVVGKIFVTEGDKVNEGDKLIILEAMKMKNIITVPYSGYIKKINVKEGDCIPKGHIIAELDIKVHSKE